jgi:hypothetical protein
MPLPSAIFSLAGCESSDHPAPTTKVVEEPTKPSGDARLAAFVPHLNEYLAYFPDAPSFSFLNDAGYIRGKVITVRVSESKYDEKVNRSVNMKGDIMPTFLDLPVEIRANSPEDVQTIARLTDCESRSEGVYLGAPGGGVAATQICKIEVIDLKKRVRLSSSTVVGPGPPQTSSTGFEVGQVEDKSIKIYLLSLPRR